LFIPNSSTIQIKYSKGVINSPIGYKFRRSRLHEFQQYRFTTSDSKSNTEDQKNKSSSVSDSSTSSTTASQAADGTLETDFANYISEAEKVETVRTQSTTRRRNRSNAVFSGLDKDKEIYEHILKASLIQKEEARIRTATNVYRALCGNVVICVGKF
jgi:cell division protein YceG involved in septum cleavage